MLVLTRKTDQQISIGDRITITVVRVGVGNVRIGIDAPADVVIARTELLDCLNPKSSGCRRHNRGDNPKLEGVAA